ncbi:MAG: hypothetical protein H7319_17855 [Spirosoma sp.]|nr:hypothetical protein [Spirosoma sp.]
MVGHAQTVRLEKWPARLQLFPRDSLSQAVVPIAGRVLADGVRLLSLVVRRDQALHQYVRTKTDPATGRFVFNPIIKAEAHQYSFDLFLHNATGDSVRVARRDSIVSGDVFLVHGQSNAVGRFDEYVQSPFYRSFGVNNGDVPYNPADTAWCLTNTTEGLNAEWNVALQRLILEQYGIPTAIMNGAAGSTSISQHAIREATNPASLNTLYGRLLYRATKAGVAGRVRAMIWRQGEAEAANNPADYERIYPQLYANWKRDYPGLKKVYHTQINLLTNDKITAGSLRDYQRRSKTIFGDNVPIATVGLPAYQGLHYSEAGYRQFGAELFRLVARDFYGAIDNSNVASPNIQKIFYSTSDQTEITLEFDPGQVMRWPADTTLTNPASKARYVQSMANFLYTDYPLGEAGIVRSVRESGNRLVLTLTKASNAQTLTYLPSSYRDNELGFYAGPTIKNQRGMRALTFYQTSIMPLLPTPSLRAIPVDTVAIRLAWNATGTAVDQWIIERADSTGQFRPIATLPGTTTTFTDQRLGDKAALLRVGAIYQYRVRSFNSLSESAYSPVATASMRLILSVNEELPVIEAVSLAAPGLAIIVPNPAIDQAGVELPPEWTGDTVTLLIASQIGTPIVHRTERVPAGARYLPISVSNLPTGTYVLTVLHRLGGIQGRLLVVR